MIKLLSVFHSNNLNAKPCMARVFCIINILKAKPCAMNFCMAEWKSHIMIRPLNISNILKARPCMARIYFCISNILKANPCMARNFFLSCIARIIFPLEKTKNVIQLQNIVRNEIFTLKKSLAWQGSITMHRHLEF